MVAPSGFSTGTTGFTSTVRTAIAKKVIETLRAGLIALPKGAVIPANVLAKVGDNWTLRSTAYPDLADAAATNPLTEGVPPASIELGIDTQDFTVAQVGAWTAVTDVASFQSPHDLDKVAPDKIARLAAQVIDNLAMTALRAHATDTNYGTVLSTDALLTAKMEMAERNIEPVPGKGFYALTSPEALLGLETEASLNGYVDVTAQAKAGDLTKGAVSQYRGITFLSSSRIAPILGAAVTLANPSAAADDIIDTSAAHGYIAGDRVRFTALTGGTGLSVDTDYYVSATSLAAQTFRVSATLGGALIDFSTDITAGTVKLFNEPVIFLGKDSLAFGDVSTMEYFHTAAPDSANPLAQFRTFGFKGILGGAVLNMSEETDGAGANGSTVPRIWTISVQSGRN
jgi:hypothetical protein